jgi:hypothetical protein
VRAFGAYTVVGILTLMIAGCDQEGARQREQIETAQQAVTSEMIDPTSVLFSDVTATATSVCGWVNGKNRLGGYAGKQRFIWSGSGHVELESESDPAKFPDLKPQARDASRCMFNASFGACKGDASAPDALSCMDWLDTSVKSN